MKDSTPRLFKYLFAAMAVLLVLLALFINRNLAALVDLMYPGLAPWTHLTLLGVELLALAWFWRGLFLGRRHLLLMNGSTPEDRKHFAKELTRRMRDNPLIVNAGLRPHGPDDPDYLARCLDVLNAKADEEIQQNARRIFLATALSQNGRLDALIVFVSLCRLIWRISRIYNQRPHPREIASLYSAVVCTTFLALSIEELDIATEITVGFGEAFHAMAPAGLTASIPFAGKALQTFTTAAIDGAANSYLALRAGIIARNAYAYGASQNGRPSRAAVFKEAGGRLLGMSHGLLDRVAAVLAEGLTGVARYAGDKTAQAGRDIVDNLGRVGVGIGNTAEKLASGSAGVVQSTGESLARAGSATIFSVGKGAGSTWNLLLSPFRRERLAPPQNDVSAPEDHPASPEEKTEK